MDNGGFLTRKSCQLLQVLEVEKNIYTQTCSLKEESLTYVCQLHAAFFRERLKSADLSTMNDCSVSKHMNADIKTESSGEDNVPPSTGKPERQSEQHN